MDVSHNFRFRWNDHVPHLSQIFSELRFDEVYCDTTLISDDGFVLKAHGAVLSTTSRYFERVLSDVTADQHPIIVLKGAHFTELSCLLDYIYEGVTQVDQHLMESVLDVADMLEIKGLSKMKNNLSIKKLIAPSPPSSVVSRSSPQCSSPSKSPTPPSHTLRTHSPSCPSSPNESYAPTSAMLKMDSEDANELSDPSQKKRLPFHDPKSSMGTSLMESKEYGGSTTTSNAPNHTVVCPNSEYSDQTLGIDLSLSRPTNEEGERSSVKNFSLHDDTPLRKRKIMKYEEFSPPPNDLEWGKVGEKVKDSMAHKKKRFFTRSDEELAPDCSYNSGASPSECLVYEETRCQRAHSSPCLEEPGLFRHFKKEPYGRENSLEEEIFSCGDEFLQGDSDFYTESDTGGGTTEKEPSHSVNVSSSNLPLPDVLIKQNLYLARSSRDFTLKERSNSGSPTSSRFHGHLKFTSKNDSGSRGESDSCHIWSHPGIVQIPDPKDLFATHKVVDSNNVTDFVSVKISKPNFSRPDVMAKPQPQVQEALRALNTRLKRPTPLIKRPLSKYTLFMKETYPPMAERYPDKKGAEILKIVSTMWRNMTDEEKHPWEERANELQREFRIRHPDYVFCPRTLHAQKQEYDMKRAEKRNLFKINPYIPYTRTQKFL